MSLPDVWLPAVVRACAPRQASMRIHDAARAAMSRALPRALTAGTLFAVALTGCNSLEPATITQPTTDPAKLYMRLTLNHPTVNLTNNLADPAANTLQLVATPYDGTGAPIADAPAAVFQSLDTGVVSVTPTGLLQGRRAASNSVNVIATLVLGEVRHTDTTVVKVHNLASAPVLETFSLQVPPEQAVWYKGSDPSGLSWGFIASLLQLIPTLTLSPQAVAAGGQSLTNSLAIDYASRNPEIAKVDRRSGVVTPLNPGYVRVVAQTMAFGVAKKDSITYTVQPSFAEQIETDSLGFFLRAQGNIGFVRPPTVTIVAGGFISWNNLHASLTDDVIFDDPTNVTSPPAFLCDALEFLIFLSSGPYCGVGNIASMSNGGVPSRFRQFPVAGVYPYRSIATGSTGTVVVVEPTPPPAP